MLIPEFPAVGWGSVAVIVRDHFLGLSAGGVRAASAIWLESGRGGWDGEVLADLTRAERIRMALTELGTTFVKLGQMLSSRADLVGQEIADELGQLQSNTPS